NGAASPSVTSVTPTTLNAQVPPGVTSGPITVTTTDGFATSSDTFFVQPKITNVSPIQAPIGATVTITGTSLTGATAVKFNGTSATTFHVDSDTQITATVPD